MPEMLDISYAQGGISAAAFASMTDIDRVVLRAARADGKLAQDSVYAGNVDHARAAGKKIGHYFFNGRTVDVATAARYFCDQVKYQPGDILVIDVESEGAMPRYSAAETLAFAQIVQARFGVWPWVYMSQSVTREDNWAAVAAVCPLWVASYSAKLGPIAPWPTYVAWQYTSSGRVPGIGGRVDLSRYSGASIAAGNVPPAPSALHITVNRSISEVQRVVGATMDGLWGPQTEAAVRVFQSAHGLTVDGVWGPKTDAAAFPPAPPAHAILSVDGSWGPSTTARLQTILGVPADGVLGPVTYTALQRKIGATPDGVWGPNSRKALQRHLGVPSDGIVGPQTVRTLQARLNAGTI